MATENEIESSNEEETGCAKCGKPMPAERAELGLMACKECTPQGKPKGIMVYSHKTGGMLEVTNDEEVFQRIKKAADDRVESL